MISGFITAITTVLLLSRVFAGQTITGQGLEFDCLTAALLGGVSFKGGEGHVFGTLIGALIIGVLRNGLTLLNISSFAQQIIIGLVIIVAVLLDMALKKSKR